MKLVHNVAQHFWYIFLLGLLASVMDGSLAFRYKFNLPTYVREPMVIMRKGCVQRGLNGETVSSRKRALAVRCESSRVREECE